ncbi:hypothetical protein [Klebsiella pneumoniae]
MISDQADRTALLLRCRNTDSSGDRFHQHSGIADLNDALPLQKLR